MKERICLTSAEFEEWMDDPAVDIEDLRASLRDLARLNRRFGGIADIVRETDLVIGGSSGSVSVLDVAAGDGYLLRRLKRHLGKRGIRMAGVALDLHPTVVRLAREACVGSASIAVERGDALSLPHAGHSFDVVVSNLSLHHPGP